MPRRKTQALQGREGLAIRKTVHYQCSFLCSLLFEILFGSEPQREWDLIPVNLSCFFVEALVAVHHSLLGGSRKKNLRQSTF